MIKDKLTIVIPSKNEGWGISDVLSILNKQIGINGTKVIIADSSDDWGSIEIIRNGLNYPNLDIQVVEGGFPAKARKIGATYVSTPYVLFLDADILILDKHLISDLIETIMVRNYHLITIKYTTDFPYSILYRLFDLFQSISVALSTPFAMGGFQLWDKEVYDWYGGFDEDDLFAEDYTLSKKVQKRYFKVFNSHIYTSPRRFKQKGIFYMIKMMFMSYINRNNAQFFKQHHNYWN
jgi:glycosyltransferase involved in cell wall biosynthesis